MARPFTEPLEARLLLCGNFPAPADSSEGLPRDLTAWSATPKRVLYILARFPDQPLEQAPGPAAARASMAQVDAIMRKNSYGRVSIAAEVTGVLVLPKPMSGPGSYDHAEWQQVLADARDAAAAAATSQPAPHSDWDFRHYDLYTVRYNGGPGDFPGAAPVRSRRSWLKVDDPWIAAHEFGHNLGLWHANALVPADPMTTTGRGHNDEYGNPFGIMGRSSGGPLAFNAWERNRLGWLPDAYVTTAAPTDAVHTYTIYPFDTTSHLLPVRRYAIRIAKDSDAFGPTDWREYWIGFRQDAGWTRVATPERPNATFNSGLASGVEINWCAWGPAGDRAEEQTDAGSNGGSQLLDMTPETPATSPESAGRRDAALTIGRTFSDDVAGIHVTPLRKRADGGIDVRVTFSDDDSHNTDPVATLAASAADVAPGQPVVLRAAATDSDGDLLSYSWDLGNGTFADGDASTTTVIKGWDAPGDYRVRLTVSDMNGGTSSDSVMVRVAARGAALPTRRLTGTVRDVLGGPLEGVRVSDGTRWAYTDSDGTYTLVVPRRTRLGPVTAAKPGWRFAPAPTHLSSSQNFDGVYTGYHVSGKVTDASGTPLSGVVAGVATRLGPRSAITDQSGDFLLPLDNGTYAVTFSKAGYLFPASAHFTIEYADRSLNGVFFGNPVYVLAEQAAVNGRILGLPPDTSMHVTVRGESAAGVRTAKATMNFNYGSPYYGMRLPVGTWNVTASGIDDSGVTFTFSPAGGWGNALAVTGSMQSIDFVLDRAARHDLTGRVVYADGPGVAGTTVRVGPRTATTADDGRYVIYGVPAGAYPIVVTKPGLRFHRASARVTDDGASAGVVTALTPSPGNVVPAIVLAEASPPTVAYRATWLTALAADEDPADRLRYTWSVFARPAGAEVTFELNSRELNGTNSAQHILALFDQPGTYILRVKAIDESGAESAAAYVRLYVGSPDS